MWLTCQPEYQPEAAGTSNICNTNTRFLAIIHVQTIPTISVRCHKYITELQQHSTVISGWRRGVVVTELVVSTKLLYAEPG